MHAAATVARELTREGGFEPPSWQELALGARRQPREPEDLEPGSTRDGWQHEAAPRVEKSFREVDLFSRMNDARRALVRSQCGPRAGLSLSTCPVNQLTTFTPAALPRDPAVEYACFR